MMFVSTCVIKWMAPIGSYRFDDRRNGKNRKAVNDNKAAHRQLKELKHHNRVMEDYEVYLAPYKRGRGVLNEKKKINAKNAKRCNYQRTTTGKTYAHSVFLRCFHAYYLTSRKRI